jgi:hypothetical protein
MDLLYELSSVLGPGACGTAGAVDGDPLLFLTAARLVPDSVWDAMEAAAVGR